MPDQENISSDTARCVLRHLMFGVLFVLIILNWSVHRPMDYEPYVYTFDMAAISERENSIMHRNRIFDNYELEGGEGRLGKVELTFYIDSQTDSIVKDLNVLIEKCETCKGANDLKIFERIISLRDSLHFPYHLFNGFPFSDTSIFGFKNLFNTETSISAYLPGHFHKILLYSLRQDVLKARSLYYDFISSTMHDESLWFEGFWSHAILDCSSFFTNKMRAKILLTKGLPLHRLGFYGARADVGNIDSIDENDVFKWNFKANILGLNTVSGKLWFKNKDTDTIVEPFSFSYFVSAPGIAFHVDKANVCYVGVPNRVSINIPGYSADKIKLRVAGAKVSKAGEGQFDIFISKMPAGKVYAYVDATNAQGRTSTVHSMELKLQHLPAPLTNFEAYKENGIALADFKAQKSIQLFPADTAFAIDYSVVSFEVECINARHQYTEGIEVKGADFETNIELQKLIASAQPGDRFIFSRIIAKATNGLSYEVLPVSVFIKDTP